MSLNKVTLLGRLGKDPEVRTANSGSRIVSFSVATSERWRDKDTGEQRERVEWHHIVIFNESLGKIAEQYLKKGAQVYLEGQMATRKWQDQSGQDRYSTEVVLKQYRGELQLIDRADRAAPDESSYGTTKSAQERAPAQSGSPSYSTDMNDDIPF